MPATILATKLYIPPPTPTLVPRTRLVKRLEVGTRRKLTLVSAPAGFGKTTLVSSWVAAVQANSGQRVAWLSLDDKDNDPARFITYLVAALRTMPGGDQLPPRVLVAVNQQLAGADTSVQAGDEVALIPPVAGG